MKTKSRSLKNYIHKVLKLISECSITSNAKHQLDCILHSITKIIIMKASVLLHSNLEKKSTLTVKTLTNIIRILFVGDLMKNMLNEGDHIIKLESDKIKEQLIFPPSYFKYYIKKYTSFKIASKCSIYLARIIEYLCSEIIDLGSGQAMIAKHSRLTPRDLYIGIYTDSELKTFFETHGIEFTKSGVVPKPIPEYKKIAADINRYQGTNQLLLSKHPFNKIVRDIVYMIDNTDIKISKYTFIILQEYIEHFIVKLLRKANNLCEHNDRCKVTGKDILFIYNIIN